MRTTGLGTSAVLVAVGAILAWAVTARVSGIDVHTVGLILFVVGLVLAAVTLLAGAVGRRTVVRTDHERLVDGYPAAPGAVPGAVDRRVVDHEVIDRGAI